MTTALTETKNITSFGIITETEFRLVSSFLFLEQKFFNPEFRVSAQMNALKRYSPDDNENWTSITPSLGNCAR